MEGNVVRYTYSIPFFLSLPSRFIPHTSGENLSAAHSCVFEGQSMEKASRMPLTTRQASATFHVGQNSIPNSP